MYAVNSDELVLKGIDKESESLTDFGYTDLVESIGY